MTAETWWLRWAALVHRRFRSLLAVSVLATVALGFGLPMLAFKSSQDTMVPSGSRVYRDNVRYQRQFGGDPMIVLFEGDIRRLFTPGNQRQLTALEHDLERTGQYHAIISPLTAVRFGADQIAIAPDLALAATAREQDSAGRAARERASAAGASGTEQEQAVEAARAQVAAAFNARATADGARLAAVGEQSLANPRFVEFLVFDDRGAIRPTFRGVFPDTSHAIMVVRLRGNMTIDEQAHAAEGVVELTHARRFEGMKVLPTGSPILLKEINDGMKTDMTTMGAVALVVMLVVLLLVFRARWRLLSLPLVLLAIVWAFGLMGFLRIPLTMVTISGLPILIGLGVDFAVQVHSRYEEEATAGEEIGVALERAFTRLGPALAVAMVAAVVGFLALRISRVPMIRDFGVMLAVGVVVLFLSALVVVPSVLVWRDTRRPARARDSARERLGLERGVRTLSSVGRGHPFALLVASLALAAGGAVAQQRIIVQSNAERYIPQDSPVLRDLHHVRDIAQSSGELGLMVEADDVMRPDVLAWMARFEARQLRRHPKQLFRSGSVASITETVTGFTPVPEDTRAILGVAPQAIGRSFLSGDRQRANIVFAVAPVSLGEEKDLLAAMHADLRPPRGVTATPSGLTVVGIEAIDALSANRALMTYAALVAVLLWLLISLRSIWKAVLPLLPVVAAVGAASIVIYLLGIEVNALSALSSPLVVATCTEFSVLVMARYLEERRNGHPPDDAIATASLRIGRAFTASGLTIAGGFGVLAFSGFPLLSNFGIVVAVNVLAALLAALVVLPPLLRRADRHLVATRASGEGNRHAPVARSRLPVPSR